MKIDTHVNVFPSRIPDGVQGQISQFRQLGRVLLTPYTAALHELQPLVRHFPAPIRFLMDESGVLASIPGLMLESIAEDLSLSMKRNEIDASLVVAYRGMISNEFVLELSKKDKKFKAVVIPALSEEKVLTEIESAMKAGAVALKIHAAAEGEGPQSKRYLKALECCSSLGLPVILHTGQIQAHFFYRNPGFGNVDLFRDWFAKFPKVNFVLAHMNYENPQLAIELARTHENVFLGTSWQPSEVIAEAVRRAGAEKILFATDWPFLGNNQQVGISRVRDCVESSFFDVKTAELIFGGNAQRVFKIYAE